MSFFAGFFGDQAKTFRYDLHVLLLIYLFKMKMHCIANAWRVACSWLPCLSHVLMHPSHHVLNARRLDSPKASHATLGRCKLHELCTATLGVGGDLREAVKLPQGEDVNEWLAVNTVDFFNAASLLYGTITEFCTSETCPQMMCGPKVRCRDARVFRVSSFFVIVGL